MLDSKALAQATAAIVKEHVAAAVAPLLERVKELESRALTKGEPGEPGKDGTSVTALDVAPIIAEEVQRAFAALPAPKDGVDGKNGADGRDGIDGKSVTIEQLEPIVALHVERAVSEIPAAKDGKDGRDGVDGKDGASGKSVSIDEIEPIIAGYVEKAVSAIPVPVDGKDGRHGLDGKDGANGKNGKDGLGAAGAMIDRSGNLILTMTDGSSKDLGPVVGKDGVNGADGNDGAPGAAGADGTDGIGFDDLDLIEDDEGLKFRFVRGTLVKDFLLPIPTDHGVWKEKLWRKGQGVTWGGSFWIAQRDTKEKPDTPDSGWRLAVKKGRDGKDVKSNA